MSRVLPCGYAKAFQKAGAELVITYLNDKAKPCVKPLRGALGGTLFPPCGVREPGRLKTCFDAIAEAWGELDFVLHSIAFAPCPVLSGSAS